MIERGDIVRFVGGTGRNNDDETLEGVVNGDPMILPDGLTLIPVYVRDGDQCVMVNENNIVV